MKRILFLLLVVVLVLSMAGCQFSITGGSSSTDETSRQSQPAEQSSLAALQKEVANNQRLIGVAYLGWFENDAQWAKEELFKKDYLKEIPFVKDIVKYAEYEGYRMYAIVPADSDVTISVCKCEFDEEYMPYPGDELIQTNQPLIVRGNMSDTIPNLYVTAKKGDETAAYPIAQSGMDGKLENNDMLFYDFTPYSSMPEFANQETQSTSSVSYGQLAGEWELVGGETDGSEYTAQEGGFEGGLVIEITEESATLTYNFVTEFINDRFEATLEYMEEPVYEGCGNDQWKAKVLPYAGDYDAEDEFAVTLTDNDTLLLQHIFPFDGTLGVSYLTYKRK